VLGSADGPSFLVASVSTTVVLLEGWIDAMAAKRVRWWSRSTLVFTVLHFLELKTVLEVLRSRRSTDPIEDEVDAIWIRVRTASDSLVSHVPSSVAHNPPDGVGV
jgi:hypothetical protein